MSNIVNEIISELTETQRNQLLGSFLSQELAKKEQEIEKNCKNEQTKVFKLQNLKSDFTMRLLKKISLTEMKAAYAASQQDEVVSALTTAAPKGRGKKAAETTETTEA